MFLLKLLNKDKNNLNLTNSAFSEKQEKINTHLNERLAIITQSADIGIWDWEFGYNKLNWDEGMKRLYGIEQENQVSSFEEWNNMIHPDEKARITDEIRKAIAGIKKFDSQFKIIHKSGEVKTIKSKATVNYDESGKPISMMGVNWDITENALATEKLRKSEELFRKIVETSQDGIWMHDETDKTIFVNPRFTEIFGYSAEEMANKNINELIDPSFQELLKIKTDNRRNGLSETYEIMCIRSSGKKIWIQVSAAPLFNNEGKYSGSLAMLSDISDRKLTEIEKEKITKDLLQRNKNMEQFSYIVSHNLRAPLANIMGCAELIKNDIVSKDELEKIINGIACSAYKLDEVVKDLNQILQIKNPLIVKRENINLNEIVREIKNTIFNSVSTHKVTLKTDFNEIEDLTSVRRYIYSIFYNLIHNSIKYQNPKVNPVIEIKSKQIEKGIKITFKDNGMGIDLQKEAQNIFGLYKRFHHDIEGKGIGLFMVKTQVETIGGSIEISSEPNCGTEFTIQLPI